MGERWIGGVTKIEANPVLDAAACEAVRADSIDALSRSIPSTRIFGYPRAIAMLETPPPQARSATRAGGSAWSREWISGTDGNHC